MLANHELPSILLHPLWSRGFSRFRCELTHVFVHWFTCTLGREWVSSSGQIGVLSLRLMLTFYDTGVVSEVLTFLELYCALIFSFSALFRSVCSLFRVVGRILHQEVLKFVIPLLSNPLELLHREMLRILSRVIASGSNCVKRKKATLFLVGKGCACSVVIYELWSLVWYSCWSFYDWLILKLVGKN